MPSLKDMTTGSEAVHLVRFAVPLFAGNLLQQLYNLVNTAVVGKYLGDEALAAVGATGSITYLYYNLCFGLASGAGILVSRYYGARQFDKIRSVMFNSGLVVASSSGLLGLLTALFAKPVLVFLGTPDKLLSAAASYMRITCGGTVAVALYNWVASVMRALGNSKTPLVFLALSSLLNLVLDLLFVLELRLGSDGAALATILSQCCAAAASMAWAYANNPDIRPRGKQARVDSVMIAQVLRLGVPIALQNALISVSMVTLQRVANSFGTSVMAAYSLSMRIEQLIQQPFQSLGSAMATFTGQNLGAGKRDRVGRAWRISAICGALLALAFMMAFFISGRAIVTAFVSSREVIALATDGLRLTSCFYLFLGFIHTTRGVLNGAGDSRYALRNGLTELGARAGFALILTAIPSVGSRGIWWTTCLTWTAAAILALNRFRQRGWKKKGTDV